MVRSKLMKNQYFGDVNDFRKYGLLRTIQRASSVAIGVCWFLTADDGGTGGGLRNIRPTQTLASL